MNTYRVHMTGGYSVVILAKNRDDAGERINKLSQSWPTGEPYHVLRYELVKDGQPHSIVNQLVCH
jgi:hypothetical protein